jgi:hypothetical protein
MAPVVLPSTMRAAELQVGRLVAEERPAGPDNVLGQPLSGLDRLGRSVLLVDEVGEADEVLHGVVQGDIEVPGRHDRGDDAVDRPEEIAEPG